MSLKGFYRENVKRDVKSHEVVISDVFKDENGKPYVWKLKPLKQTTLMNISNKHLEVIVDMKKHTSTTKGSTANYNLEVMARTVEYPDLNNKELQNSYGVMNAQELLEAMLDNEEFNRLLTEVNKVNEIKSQDELVEEVKN